MIYNLQRQKAVRIAGVLALLCFVWLSLVHAPETGLTDRLIPYRPSKPSGEVSAEPSPKPATPAQDSEPPAATVPVSEDGDNQTVNDDDNRTTSDEEPNTDKADNKDDESNSTGATPAAHSSAAAAATSSSKTTKPSAAAPPPPPAKPRSRIAKVTVAAGQLSSPIISKALAIHQRHNLRHGYEHYIASNEAVAAEGHWTKPAYLSSIIVNELQKPIDERLEWLFWFDADTLIMNHHTPLEIFLPPNDMPLLSNVDIFMASNWDGINNGVFGLRVNQWSVSFLAAVSAYPNYQAEKSKKDAFRDQSAFNWVLNKPESPFADTDLDGKIHYVNVPMRWFNSLPVNNAFYKNGTWIFGSDMTPAQFDDGTEDIFDDGHGKKINPWKIMRGDMVVHFAGSSYVRDSWMTPWIERAEKELPEWNDPSTREKLALEVQKFWADQADKIAQERFGGDKEKRIEEEEKLRKEFEENLQKEKEKAEKMRALKKLLDEVSVASATTDESSVPTPPADFSR